MIQLYIFNMIITEFKRFVESKKFIESEEFIESKEFKDSKKSAWLYLNVSKYLNDLFL